MGKERWLDVVGYEGYYQVSDHGQVRSVGRVITELGTEKQRAIPGVVLKKKNDRDGYPTVNLSKNNKLKTCYVHALLLSAFVLVRPDGMECRHLDGDPSNNHLDNLAWGTRSENGMDKARHGTSSRKLTETMVRDICRMRERGDHLKTLSARFGVSTNYISLIARGGARRNV